MRAMMALVLHLGGVGECVRLIWEWMDRLCKGLSIPRNQGIYNKCPCCTIHAETAKHVLLCPEAGRVKAFLLCTSALEWWLDEADTDPDLTDSIVEYVQWQGTVMM